MTCCNQWQCLCRAKIQKIQTIHNSLTQYTNELHWIYILIDRQTIPKGHWAQYITTVLYQGSVCRSGSRPISYTTPVENRNQRLNGPPGWDVSSGSPKMSQPRSVPGLRRVSRSLRRNSRDRGINQNRQSIKYISRNFIYSKKNKQILIKYINKSYLQIYKNTIVMSVNKPGKTVGLLHTVPG